MIRFITLLAASSFLAASEPETVEPPTSFAREVLQPIGMPVVALYHHVKESPFLNMARTDASGLEAIGDFFLAPSRYLFGGKNVQLHQGNYQLTSSFRYGKYDWLKTTVSILSFPVTEIFGCLFKGSAFLFSDTRKNYQLLYQMVEETHLTPHYNDYLQQGVSTFTSNEFAPCLNLQRPSVLPEKHRIELKAFQEVCELLDNHGIIYWLDCGSCLGAYRHGGMIPWDDDIDISILAADHENVKKILRTLDPDQYQIQDWSSYRYPQTFMKLYIKQTKTLIDIYHYTLDPVTRQATYFYTYKDSPLPEAWKKFELVMTKPLPYETLFPLKKTVFDGIPTWVPNQIEQFLQMKYGENLSPVMIWDEPSQTYRKVKDHPYWTLFD